VTVFTQQKTAFYQEYVLQNNLFADNPHHFYVKSQKKRNRFNALYGKKNMMMVELNKELREKRNRNENEFRSKYRSEKRKAHRLMIDLIREQAA
jgi:NAD-dependent SIR2 family protein deacetylase